MADSCYFDDGFPVLDSCQDAVDTDAPAPTGISALKLFSIRCAARVLASFKVLLDPRQDYEPLLLRDVEELLGRRLRPFDAETHSASIAIRMTYVYKRQYLYRSCW